MDHVGGCLACYGCLRRLPLKTCVIRSIAWSSADVRQQAVSARDQSRTRVHWLKQARAGREHLPMTADSAPTWDEIVRLAEDMVTGARRRW